MPKAPGTNRSWTGEEAALRALGLSARQCAQIATRAAALGVGPEQVAIAWGLAGEDDFYAALARVLGIEFVARPFAVDRDSVSVHSSDAGLIRRADGRVVLAPQGEALRAFLASRPAGCCLTSPRILRESLRAAFATCEALTAAALLPLAAPRETALRDGHASGFIIAAWLTALVAVAFWEPLFAAPVTVPLSLLFAWTIGQRIMAIGIFRDKRQHATPPPLSPLHLPVYSILVPLFQEDRVLAQLVGALEGLDYPPEKLEIVFLVEDDDAVTHAALARFALLPHMRILSCPKGAPRTKPRALNIGLRECRGEFVAIYDAEDRPEPDQLAKAAALFRASPEDIACLQAEIAIDNGETNFWTRGFALEYAALFQIVVPGLCALGLPVALGGTSNHFRRSVLVALHGWDAWNVTEDADIGLRLALHGYRVAHLNSRTWEEAPDEWGIWRRQRIRWIKGWMQTSLVHLRETRRRWHVLSVFGRIGVLHHLIGTPVAALLTPLFTVALLVGIATGKANIVQQGFVAFGVALACAAGAMMVALFGNAEPALAARARRQALWTWPAYLLLVCASAWLALVELVRAPFRWNKTPHGLALPVSPAMAAPARGRRPARRDPVRGKAASASRPQEAPPRPHAPPPL